MGAVGGGDDKGCSLWRRDLQWYNAGVSRS